MEQTEQTQLISKIENIKQDRGLTSTQFRGLAMMAGLSYDTAERLDNGETNFNLKSIGKLANYLNLKIGDLIDVI